MIVRHAALPDAPSVVRLWKEMWDYHSRLDPRYQTTPAAEQVMQGWIEENIRGERSLVLVAEDDGRIAGYLLGMILENPPVVPNQFLGYVSEIAVTESGRKKGTGKMLLDASHDWFRAKGMPFVEVNVSTKNPDAVRFWKREGYKDYLVRLRMEI